MESSAPGSYRGASLGVKAGSMKLNNQVAIVTGGGRGIGREIALSLAREGADVAVSGRYLDVLSGTSRDIEALGRKSLALVTDVSQDEQVRTMIQTVLEKFGQVDILVNNAGIAGPTLPASAISRSQWDEVLAVNLTSAFLCAQAVTPGMVERRSGRIINISSIAGKLGYALRGPYAASKWGMIGLTRTLALELGPHNITVNAICPGPTAGPRMDQVITARAQEMGRSIEEVEKDYVSGTALKRMVNPQHVADLVVFLASESGSSITGEAIDVSAGYAI
jgi:NAD(P)-dependent dehydrogenase (short-subunit alcohol dehydrogenase family)